MGLRATYSARTDLTRMREKGIDDLCRESQHCWPLVVNHRAAVSNLVPQFSKCVTLLANLWRQQTTSDRSIDQFHDGDMVSGEVVVRDNRTIVENVKIGTGTPEEKDASDKAKDPSQDNQKDGAKQETPKKY